MTIKTYRYPSDLEKLEEEYKDLEVLGDYANYEEDEYMTLPVVPDEIATVLDELYAKEEGTLPLVVQYTDNKKDLGGASVGDGYYWDGQFSEEIGKYYIAMPEYGLHITVVPKELKEDLDFVLKLHDFKDTDWLPDTIQELKNKFEEYGLDFDSSIYNDIKKKYGLEPEFYESLDNHEKIRVLNDLVDLSGSIDLSNTKIKSLPENFEVKFDLDLYRAKKIKELPKGLKVGGSINGWKSGILSVAEDIEVGGELDLSDTKVSSLPSSLKVGRDLKLEDTNITSLPEGLKVGKGIKLPDGTWVYSVKEANKYLEKQNKQKNSSKETRLSKALKKISTSRTAKEVAKDLTSKTREEMLARGIECNKEQAQKLLETYYHFNFRPDNNGKDIIYYAHNIKTGNEEEVAFWLEQDNKLYIQDKKVYNKILPEVSRVTRI